MDVLARFRSKVSVMESGCHEWRSTLHRDGYGKFWFDGKQEKAHRMAHLLFVGEIPDGKWVLHTCDNRKCVNPSHLYLGDAKQNVADKLARCSWFGNMRKTRDEIDAIRARYLTGAVSQQQLAGEYGVHQTQISRYVRGTQRTHR
jgi:hypothetical protein